MAAAVAVMTVFVSTANHSGPNGTPAVILGYRTEIRPQKTNCVYTGVPRKNQTQAQLDQRNTGFSDWRMNARRIARMMARTMEAKVSSSVQATPCTTLVSRM